MLQMENKLGLKPASKRAQPPTPLMTETATATAVTALGMVGAAVGAVAAGAVAAVAAGQAAAARQTFTANPNLIKVYPLYLPY